MPYDNDNIKLRYKAALGHLLYVGCPKADVFVFSGRCGALRFEVCKTSNVPGREHRRKAEKGFKFVCAKLLSVCAESRFGKPRNFLQENDFILFACTKRTKSTPEVCEPLDSGDDSKLCRRRF